MPTRSAGSARDDPGPPTEGAGSAVVAGVGLSARDTGTGAGGGDDSSTRGSRAIGETAGAAVGATGGARPTAGRRNRSPGWIRPGSPDGMSLTATTCTRWSAISAGEGAAGAAASAARCARERSQSVSPGATSTVAASTWRGVGDSPSAGVTVAGATSDAWRPVGIRASAGNISSCPARTSRGPVRNGLSPRISWKRPPSPSACSAMLQSDSPRVTRQPPVVPDPRSAAPSGVAVDRRFRAPRFADDWGDPDRDDADPTEAVRLATLTTAARPDGVAPAVGARATSAAAGDCAPTRPTMSAALTSRATPWPIGAATTGADRGRAARWWRGTLTATSHTIAHAT